MNYGTSMMILKSVSAILIALTLLVSFSACGKQNTEEPKKTAGTVGFAFRRKPTSDVIFLSTQLNPVEEAAKMRNVILKDFPGNVDFRPNDNSYLFSQIDSLLQSNPKESILIGALHGDLVTLFEKGVLLPLDDAFGGLEKRTFSENLMRLSRLDGKHIYYVPWMQASFVMVANKKALAYLPEGARLNELTYDQLYLWVRTMYEKIGMNAIGFPAGEKGLMHRFFQGYLYPSFTASTLLRFRSSDAKIMWEYFKELWKFAHRGSLVYSTMAEPLLAGDVWIGWDHTARLTKIFEEKPNEFVAFPAPIGPKGRGFIAVISGLSIPGNQAHTKDAELLIDYLTEPVIQIRMLSETGFFPVVASGEKKAIPEHLRELSAAVNAQAESRNAVPTLLPIGLSVHGGDYNLLFMLTFSEIILEHKDITAVLNENAAELQNIIDAAQAKCWLPDVSEERPCRLE